MCNIDYILDLLDWSNSQGDQEKGIELAKGVKSINVFIQPTDKCHNKNVWENCAKVLSNRTDDELQPYLIDLFEWLQDLTWPGALCILKRLKCYENNRTYSFAFNDCVKRAELLGDEVWLNILLELKR